MVFHTATAGSVEAAYGVYRFTTIPIPVNENQDTVLRGWPFINLTHGAVIALFAVMVEEA